MRARIGLALLLAPIVAHAGVPPVPVIGGSAAPVGKYPEIAAVPFDNNDPQSTYCTGTLIAKNVVITAGHCVNQPPTPATALVGTNSLAHPELGEVITVASVHEYPSSQTSVDVGILVLSKDSKFEPRPLATGWAGVDVKNGAMVAFAGYGSIDKNGMTYIPELQEATSTVTDFDCTTNLHNGCNAAAQPDGELAAGGMGIDTCPGDSGGPLFLVASYGTFLAGVTSRGFDNSQFQCSEGGIYERPDHVVDWIEQVAGGKVAHGPEPMFDPLVPDATGGSTTIAANDPASDKHTFAITTMPANGMAAVRDDGEVKVCPTAAGDDSLVVTITDSTNPMRTLAVTVKYTATAAASKCSLDGFAGDDGGCCSGGRGRTGSAMLAIGLGVILLRRRAR